MTALLESFQVKFSFTEASEIERLQQLIMQSHEQVEGLKVEELQGRVVRLAPFRLRSSGTLKSGDVQSWVEANIYVSEKVRMGAKPQWSDILQINEILTRAMERSGVRTQEIFLGPWKATSPDDLESSIQWFEKEILNGPQENPLIQAALVQFFLVSLHPFWDGNGRTSVLISDWILALNGYLPQTFERQTDAIIGFFEGREPKAWKSRAVLKVFGNILHGYKIVLGEMADSAVKPHRKCI